MVSFQEGISGSNTVISRREEFQGEHEKNTINFMVKP